MIFSRYSKQLNIIFVTLQKIKDILIMCIFSEQINIDSFCLQIDMTMFIRFLQLNLMDSKIEDINPFIIICDNNGKQLKRTSPKKGHTTSFDQQEAIICSDTLESILFYVYHFNPFRQDQLIGNGSFNFSSARSTPYQAVQKDIPIVLQTANKGHLSIKAEYNMGQIFIGLSSNILMSGGEIPRKTKKRITDSVIESDYGTITPVEKRQSGVLPTPRTTTAVSPFYHSGTPMTQDGLVQIQMVDFYPNYNLFSMMDKHQPGTMFNFIQPHLRRVYYN